MLGRIALAGMMLAALGAPVALAGPGYVPIWQLRQQCQNQPETVKLCAHQFAFGDRNWSVTYQKTVLSYPRSSSVFGVTVQKGDDNLAYTGQNGTDLSSKTIQVGDDNFAGTYQVGDNQESETVQIGDGIWSSKSSIGDDASMSVELRSW